MGARLKYGRFNVAYETLAFEIQDHVADVRLNRPKALNTMILTFWQEMVDVFHEIEDRGDVRAVVLSSTGRHFTAGLDLSAFSHLIEEMGAGEPGRVREQMRTTVLEMQESFNVIERCRVPVLAAVQGACIGGGVDLISACDARYATEKAFFCIQEINIGMTADVGTLQRLPHLMPAGKVRELAYTGRRMPAAEAKDCGLVNEVFASQDEMLAHVREVARTIAGKSPLAIAGTKEMLNYTRDHSVAEGLNYISVWQSGMFYSDDLMEAARANAEKRKPEFKDLLPPRRYVKRRG
jgi:enoyl-CoA hydratase